MKGNLAIIAIICLFQSGYGQNHIQEFKEFYHKNDTANQLKTLINWEKSNPGDPELYAAYFNYHFSKSKKEVVVLTTGKLEGDVLELKDSLDNTAGYLGTQIDYDKKEMLKGIAKINRGINLHQNRLDLRFGKIYALGTIYEWDDFTSEIIKTIQHSSVNNNKWLWTNNETITDGQDFLLDAIQDYQGQLYNTGNDDLLPNMRNIANEVLKFYPTHVESLSNLSITYLLTEDYQKGVDYLLKAEKIRPHDQVILLNIAYGYKLMDKPEKAIQYYQKTIEHGDEEAKEYAKSQIAEIKQ